MGHKPIALDPNNSHRIVEIGDLVSTMKPVAAVAFAWQVLAVITAQKFMANITRQLAIIGEEVDEIRQFLLDEKEAEIIANHQYLMQITSSVLEAGVSPEEAVVIGTQLEDIERQSSRTLHVAMKSARRRLKSLKQTHGGAFFKKGFEQFVEYSDNERDRFVEYSRLCLLSLSVRCVATYLRAALPLSKSIAKNRLDRVRGDLGSYTALQSNFQRKILSLNETMVARLWQDESAFVKDANASVNAAMEHLQGRCREIEKMTKSIEAAINGDSGPAVVYARVESDRVSLLIPDEAKSADGTPAGPHVRDRVLSS